jgi:hypothetical protein
MLGARLVQNSWGIFGPIGAVIRFRMALILICQKGLGVGITAIFQNLWHASFSLQERQQILNATALFTWLWTRVALL